MSIKTNVKSSGDVVFEAALLLAPASNYSDGIDKGFRPAISWAMVRLPDNVIRSGMMNLKDHNVEPTSIEAEAAARTTMFTGDCMCAVMVDMMLEEYEREV